MSRPSDGRLFRRKLVVLDTETTGLVKHRWAQVIELAGVMLDEDGEEVGVFERLVHAEPPPEADEALRINGISRDMLLTAGRPMAEVVKDFQLFVGPAPVTSFNVDFDAPMLKRMGLEMRFGDCIMLAAHRVMGAAGALPMQYGRPKWPSLREACLFFGVPQVEPSHRALSDARMAAAVLMHLRQQGAI